MLEKGKRWILDKLLFPVRTGKLKCTTEKGATAFKDGLLDLALTLFGGSAFVLLLFLLHPSTRIDAWSSWLNVFLV